jgi:hypothetical protein
VLAAPVVELSQSVPGLSLEDAVHKDRYMRDVANWFLTCRTLWCRWSLGSNEDLSLLVSGNIFICCCNLAENCVCVAESIRYKICLYIQTHYCEGAQLISLASSCSHVGFEPIVPRLGDTLRTWMLDKHRDISAAVNLPIFYQASDITVGNAVTRASGAVWPRACALQGCDAPRPEAQQPLPDSDSRQAFPPRFIRFHFLPCCRLSCLCRQDWRLR